MIYLYARLARLFRSKYLFYGYKRKIREINAAALVGLLLFIWTIALFQFLPFRLFSESKNLVVLSGTFVALAIGMSRTTYVKYRLEELLKKQVTIIRYDIGFIALTAVSIVVLLV